MAQPTTKEEFKSFCKRKLGDGAIQINVTDEQIDDRVAEAIRYYQEYHYDGHIESYLPHQISSNDFIENGDRTDVVIEMDDEIMGVNEIFPIGYYSSSSINNIFNVVYQFALNDLYNLASQDLTPYYMGRMNLSLIEELLVGKQPIQYNKVENKLHLIMDEDRVDIGDYIIIDAYLRVVPEKMITKNGQNIYPFKDVWKDKWLQNYATALIEQQWGTNLSKFSGMSLPGNVTFDGNGILERANTKLEKLEEQLSTQYAPVIRDFYG